MLMTFLFQLLFLVIASPLTLTPTEVANADNILGRWDITVQAADESYASWLEVVAGKESGKYHGRFVGHCGSTRPIARIDFRDSLLNFTLPPQCEKMTKHLTFTGQLVGDKLEGTTEGENGKRLYWTGVRAPDLIPPAKVRWGTPIELFNNRDLTGWKLRSEKGADCWSVEDGTLTNTTSCVDIITTEHFKDFKLHLEFKLPEKSNSGVYLRGRYEVQIVDDYGKEPNRLGTGGVYGFLLPFVNAIKPANEWQTYDITLVGRYVTIILNGKKLIEGLEIPGITGGALDSDENRPGPLMLQGNHGKVWFRNIILTPTYKPKA